MSILDDLKEALMKGNANKVKEGANQALEAGLSPLEVINDGLIAAMNAIGVRFKNNEVYVPEVLIAARAMHAGLNVVKPLLGGDGLQTKGTVVLGTVKGDLHDIGKNLVIMMLEGAGYKVVDLGVDVPADKFVAAAREYQAHVVGLSALLTTTMVQMKSTAELLKENVRGIKVMIGGAPVTQKFADDIGADGYAADAASAVDLVNMLLAAS